MLMSIGCFKFPVHQEASEQICVFNRVCICLIVSLIEDHLSAMSTTLRVDCYHLYMYGSRLGSADGIGFIVLIMAAGIIPTDRFLIFCQF